MLKAPNVNGTVLTYLLELTQLYCTELGYNAIKGCFTITFIGIEDIHENFESSLIEEYMDFVENNTGLTLDLYITEKGIIVVNNEENKRTTIEPKYVLSYDIDSGITAIMSLLGLQQSMCVMCSNITYEEEIKIINTIISNVRGTEFRYQTEGYIFEDSYLNVITYTYGLDSTDYLSISVEYDDSNNTYTLYAKTADKEIEYTANYGNIIHKLNRFVIEMNNLIRV